MCGITIITVIKNMGSNLELILNRLEECLSGYNKRLSIILVDIGSDDNTLDESERLLKIVPNIQYFGLSGVIYKDHGYLAGMEHATPGDIVVLFNPVTDDPTLITEMIDKIDNNHDLVITTRSYSRNDEWPYRILSGVFVSLFKLIGQSDIRGSSSRFRALSPRAISHIIKYDATAIGYNTIPFISRFKRANLVQGGSSLVEAQEKASITGGVRRALSLVSVFSQAPMRFVSMLCIATAILCLVSSIYVFATYFFNDKVVPGWTTLSLQMNAMFFFISLSLAIIAEYIMTIRQGSNPPYHLVSNFNSLRMDRTLSLNIVKQNPEESK